MSDLGHYHDPLATYDYCDDPTCPRVRDHYLPNGMLRSVTPWSADEELARQRTEADIEQAEELAYELEQERQQRMHDEMIDSMVADGLIP